MSLLKKVSTVISGQTVEVNLPDKKTILLRGRNSLQVIFIIESLLRQDFTDYFRTLDKQFGYDYSEPEGTSYIRFNDGIIMGKDKAIQIQGQVPNIHVVRYLGSCNKIRSSYMSETMNTQANTEVDMTKYSHIIFDSQWIRLIASVNSILGFEFVKLENEQLQFNFDNTKEIGVEGQEIIYLLIAECTLTPEGYSRVLLLPNIPYLSPKTQVKLLEVLDNFRGHTLTLSLANIQPSDLSASSIISFLNV